MKIQSKIICLQLATSIWTKFRFTRPLTAAEEGGENSLNGHQHHQNHSNMPTTTKYSKSKAKVAKYQNKNKNCRTTNENGKLIDL